MTREEVTEIHHILWDKNYRQMEIRTTISDWEEGVIEVHCNSIMVDPNVEEIKKLIGDKYHVSGDTNSETITIK